MFNDRFNLDVTLYNRKTRNDIVAATVSLASGYSTALYNVGAISNKGIELLIGGTPLKPNLSAGTPRLISPITKARCLACTKTLPPCV
jgi:hypothetical protein